LHGAVLALALRHPGWGFSGPSESAEAEGIFSAEVAVSEPPGPPAPSLPVADVSLPDTAPTPAPVAVESPKDMILPLDSGVHVAAPVPAMPRHTSTVATGGKGMRRVGGSGTGHGKGDGGGGGGGWGTYVAPSYLRNPAPIYPREARLARREGLVLLEVVVNGEGTPIEVDVVSGSGDEEMDRAAVAAVRGWRFRPATVEGRSVEGKVKVPVRFRLRG